MKKQIICLVLAFVLLLCLLPATAMAGDVSGTINNGQIANGDTWTVPDGQVLTVTGTLKVEGTLNVAGSGTIVVASGATLTVGEGGKLGLSASTSTTPLTINDGGKLDADATVLENAYGTSTGSSNKAKITSGTYSSDPSAYIDKNQYHAVKNETDNTYTVGKHDYEYSEEKSKEADTCKEDGYNTYICSGCLDEYKEEIPAHRIGPWHSNSTSHWHQCCDCGKKLDEVAHDNTTSCSVCGYPKRITEISLGIDTPKVGEEPAETTQYTAEGTVILPQRPWNYEVKILKWYKLSEDKDPNNGGWTLLADGEKFTTGYYYRLSANVLIDSTYSIDEKIQGTINGVATDTRMNHLVQPIVIPDVLYPQQLSYYSFILEAFYEPLELTDIAVNVTEPSIGATPDYKPTYTVKSSDSATLSTSLPGLWIKIAKDKYVEGSFSGWEDVGAKEQYKADYYYAFIIAFDVNDGYEVNKENLTATINGKEAKVEAQTDSDEKRVVVAKIYGPLTEPVSETTTTTTNAPATDDGSTTTLWAVLALTSLGTLGAAYRKKRSR